MRRVLRYLRIAFSTTGLIACVLLIALWVRSYWRLDVLKAKPPDLELSASSLNGKLVFEQSDAPRHDWDAVQPWELTSETVGEDTYLSAETIAPEYSRLKIEFTHAQVMRRSFFSRTPGDYESLALPHYYPVALTALVAGIPWIPWSRRFGLRTLLVAMTLIAGGLGLYVWMRAPQEDLKAQQQEVRWRLTHARTISAPSEYTVQSYLPPQTTNGTISGGLNPY